LEIRPNFVEAYNGWGNALASFQRPDEAIDKYKKALEINPNNAWAYSGWGDVLFTKGDDNGGNERYREGIRRNPNFEGIYPKQWRRTQS
jgi:tetratricopeptide (TPR) repeat protein